MHVEVTGRQTGKTSRLIDSVIEFLTDNPDKTALIVSNNRDNRKLTQEKVHSKCGRPCEYRTITSYRMLPSSPTGTIKQFVDEFGYVSDLELDLGAYYCGTPPLNMKAQNIWEYYKQTQALKPNNVLKNHKL